MSYNQMTDIKKVGNSIDFKNNLIKSTQVLKQVRLNDNICVIFKKDKWYYTVEDVALWAKCGSVKTVLFYRLRNKPKGKIITFHGKEQFLFRYKTKYAIYSVQVYGRNSYNENIITHVGFTKIPNLKECGI